MLREELLDAPGMHAEEHQIRLGQVLPGVLADLIHNSLLQGVAKGGLAHIHPHPLKIFKLFQPHSDGAADQAQADDRDLSAHKRSPRFQSASVGTIALYHGLGRKSTL